MSSSVEARVRAVLWMGCLLLVARDAMAQPNFLFLIADDVGVERVAAYGEHPDPGFTPNIDLLAAQGVLFRNAWSTPMCSATRASVLTGKQPIRHGVGGAIGNKRSARWPGLDPAELTLPKVLAPLGYESFVVGKWHLASGPDRDPMHALLAGFDHHSGSLANIGYSEWPKYVDGVLVDDAYTVYPTTDSVDTTLDYIQAASGPWLGWVAFNAPHTPFHDPPAHLHSFGDPVDPAAESRFKAAVEALDTEIGRLLASIDPAVLANTVVVFFGDNGTSAVINDGAAGANGTVYEGGVNVPLIVAGPVVPPASRGQEASGLVHVLDLFATAIELSGATAAGQDSVSLVPYLTDPGRASVRPVVYTEKFRPFAVPTPTFYYRAVRNERYKLIRQVGRLEMYDLVVDPLEQNDLLLAPLGSALFGELVRLNAAINALGDPVASP